MKEGDKDSGICNKCSKVVDVTFKTIIYKNKNKLCGICDECGSIVIFSNNKIENIKNE